MITEFDVGRAESVIRKYRGKPAVMGWNPGDEPAPKGITPQEMFRRYDSFKQIDSDHIAYTVICVPSQYANYAAGTDVLAPDPYPVPRRPVDDVYRRFKEAKAAANKADTALWAVGQAFGGQKYDKKGSWPRWPDAREFRAMSYLSLMAGAKGIIYYVFSDGSFDIRQAPDLLEAVQMFPAEMRGIVPFAEQGDDGNASFCRHSCDVRCATRSQTAVLRQAVLHIVASRARRYRAVSTFTRCRSH